MGRPACTLACLHPHAFRHDAEGLSARVIADYLGHERVSMTQDVYVARRGAGTAASAALDRFAPGRNSRYSVGRSRRECGLTSTLAPRQNSILRPSG